MRIEQVGTVTLVASAVADDTPYVLVDLSDTTNFPHTKTGAVHLLGMTLNAEKATDGAYSVYVGVVTENDGTDGSVTWAHVFNLASVDNPTDSTDRLYANLDFTRGGSIPAGIDLTVSGGETPYLVSNSTQDDSANWQNDTNRTGPSGNIKPAAGDLVMLVDETAGEGTISFCVTVQYETV